MSEQPQLGKLPETNAQRDAIHIAIIPVTSNETLYPGEKIQLIKGTTDRVVSTKYFADGVVDPFLSEIVPAETQFYMCLYPNTVTGMRHHWQHPKFDAPSIKDDKGASIKWMEEFAAEHYYFPHYFSDMEKPVPYTADQLIEAGKEFLKSGDRHVQVGDESLRDDLGPQTRKEFWHHFSIITEIAIEDEFDQNPFCCTC